GGRHEALLAPDGPRPACATALRLPPSTGAPPPPSSAPGPALLPCGSAGGTAGNSVLVVVVPFARHVSSHRSRGRRDPVRQPAGRAPRDGSLPPGRGVGERGRFRRDRAS